MISGKACILSI